jgi:hypothetical protein
LTVYLTDEYLSRLFLAKKSPTFFTIAVANAVLQADSRLTRRALYALSAPPPVASAAL